MQRITFCSRCRGLRVGWNRPYIFHCICCKEWVSRSSKLLVLTFLSSILVFSMPTPAAFLHPGLDTAGSNTIAAENQPAPQAEAVSDPGPDPAIARVQRFLREYRVGGVRRARIAEAIAHSSRRYGLDPRLIASVVIVESSANPFAISDSDAIGIMQIHVPTWGETIDQEGINLFKIEDNIDFGVRILKGYVKRFGVWQGVKRYRGWNPDSPESNQNADLYVQKIQRIYEGPVRTASN